MDVRTTKQDRSKVDRNSRFDNSGTNPYDGKYAPGSGRKGVYRGKTVLAGSFPANGFNLHDMHGNVREWVENCWHGDYEGAPDDGRPWTTGGNCGYRVLRGGSWFSGPRNMRSANRSWNSSGNRSNHYGFRVARTMEG